MNNRWIFSLMILLQGAASAFTGSNDRPPNVILVLTDDQGIGDLGCHGNPWLKTPNIDSFHDEAVRLTNFHVSPLCTPTRSAIMTGRYPINNGAWATFKGRDSLSPGAITMADIFQQNGYTTAMFGKWHLGDNYPSRPTDSGFETAIHHLGGGVGELSDYWGNSYFDDTYYVNNQPRPFKGYCTDIWFDEAMKFIGQHKKNPFFLYLPTNAPHDPLIVADKYAEPYKELEGTKIVDAKLYGMIANLDENFGKLRRFLQDQNLVNNTILIFMSDNGSRYGFSNDGKLGYNNGYRGIKGAKLEGGHRVPFFIRWPDGQIEGGKDISDLAAHVDLIPTLASLCNLTIPSDAQLDGMDISPLLTGKKKELPSRTVFVHHRQDWRAPADVDQTCILRDQWRLLNGNQLFDITKDPQEKNNVAAQHPEVVRQLLGDNSTFLQSTKTGSAYKELPVQTVGSTTQHEIKLTIQHAIGEDSGIWKCEQVAEGMKNRNNLHALEIEEAGDYIISCRRWPKECPGPILGIPTKNPKDMFDYQPIAPQKVRIQIANHMLKKAIGPKDEAIEFRVTLPKGKTLLTNDFVEGDDIYGVYYTYVRPAY